eukprot:Filipodium_phascolosomae@DN3783_c0_g1_i1.p1
MDAKFRWNNHYAASAGSIPYNCRSSSSMMENHYTNNSGAPFQGNLPSSMQLNKTSIQVVPPSADPVGTRPKRFRRKPLDCCFAQTLCPSSWHQLSQASDSGR